MHYERHWYRVLLGALMSVSFLASSTPAPSGGTGGEKVKAAIHGLIEKTGATTGCLTYRERQAGSMPEVTTESGYVRTMASIFAQSYPPQRALQHFGTTDPLAIAQRHVMAHERGFREGRVQWWPKGLCIDVTNWALSDDDLEKSFSLVFFVTEAGVVTCRITVDAIPVCTYMGPTEAVKLFPWVFDERLWGEFSAEGREWEQTARPAEHKGGSGAEGYEITTSTHNGRTVREVYRWYRGNYRRMELMREEGLVGGILRPMREVLAMGSRQGNAEETLWEYDPLHEYVELPTSCTILRHAGVYPDHYARGTTIQRLPCSAFRLVSAEQLLRRSSFDDVTSFTAFLRQRQFRFELDREMGGAPDPEAEQVVNALGLPVTRRPAPNVP